MRTRKRLTLLPEIAFEPEKLTNHIQQRLGLDPGKVFDYKIEKRSIDARKAPIKVHLELEIYLDEQIPEVPDYKQKLQDVSKSEPVVIVGAGPAGMFAALRLIEAGLKPVILERGKDVRARRRDLAAINKHHIVNPDSNYCFGEGGAGTYSDGKLYTRAKKRGDVQQILQVLVSHGAPSDILFEAHPHIGTNKLPKVVTEIRESILESGGEIYFNSPVDDLVTKHGRLTGVVDRSGVYHSADIVILATGHSARDVYTMLQAKGISLEVKPFALGLRVEHPQSLIDKIQYHGCEKGLLPAASYALNKKLSDDPRSVFSFCMCPGGFIVPAATSSGEIVVNGMSPSRRDSKFANSGIVVNVSPKDMTDFSDYGALAGMHFQKSIEQAACELAGGTQTAPAQRLMDFVNNAVSVDLPETSYQPGVSSQPLDEILPPSITEGIKQGFLTFGKRMKGFLTNEAILLGVESRTSAPVKIPRNPETLHHPELEGLIPCGEGAGYAGGIMSAAMDGIRCAEAAIKTLKPKVFL